MIFVTVGGQLPFDRLIRALDEWAGDRGVDDVFAQLGAGEYTPENFPSTDFLNPTEFDQRARAADVIVAHAGMGTILTALEYGKPILVFPRRHALGEQRNDHQSATAKHLSAAGKVRVAMDEGALCDELDRLGELEAAAAIGRHASADLLARLRAFVQESAR